MLDAGTRKQSAHQLARADLGVRIGRVLPPHRVVVRPTRRLDNEPLALVAYAFGRASHCPASFDDLAASPHPIRSRSLSASPAVHFWPPRARSAFSNGGGSGSRIILAPLPPNGGGPGF